MQFTTRTITYMAMLIALNVILTRFFSVRIPFEGIDGIRLGFGTLPLILGGVLLGARAGFLLGVIGDLAGFALAPSGMYLPTFTLVAGGYGALAGVVFRLKDVEFASWQLYIAIAASQLASSLIFTPCLLSLHFGLPFWLTMPGRLLSQAILIPCYCLIIGVLLNRLSWFGAYPVKCKGFSR